MEPDVQTLGIAIVLAFAGNLAFAWLLKSKDRAFPGDLQWLLGQTALTAGFLLRTLNAFLPHLVHDVVANTLILSSNFLFAHSIWLFRWGRTFPLYWYGVIPLGFFLLFAALERSYRWEVALFDLLLALGSALPAVLFLVKASPAERSSMAVIALPFVAYSIFASIGFVHNLSALSTVHSEKPTLFDSWFYFGALLMASLSSFGFFVLGTLHHIRTVEKKDAAIHLQTQRLEEQNRSKDLFFSIIAHDLRGPIGGLARYTRKHLLGKMDPAEARFSDVETVVQSLEKTQDFLEKLLWWSRSQLIDWTPSWSRINLERVFDETAKIVNPLAAMKGIQIEYPAPAAPDLMADEECITLILANLLTNAVKFSHLGSTVRLETSQAANSFELAVIDEGIGMSEKVLERLFVIENKLSTQGTSGETGSGMGLILAQSLAQRIDGGLELTSEPGKGTRATLWLPLRIG